MEITKVLVRLPDRFNELSLVFPFLHVLREEIKGEVELTLLGRAEFRAYFRYVGVKHAYASLPEKELGFLETHRFAYNQKDLFNIDYYFDLEGGFLTGFMGFCFRAKTKIGFATKWTKFWYHHFSLVRKIDTDASFFPLLGLAFKENSLKLELKLKRELPAVVLAEGVPQISLLFVLDDKDEASLEWMKLAEDCAIVGEYQLIKMSEEFWPEFTKRLFTVKRLVTNSAPIAYLASYFGVKSVCLSPKLVFTTGSLKEEPYLVFNTESSISVMHPSFHQNLESAGALASWITKFMEIEKEAKIVSLEEV